MTSEERGSDSEDSWEQPFGERSEADPDEFEALQEETGEIEYDRLLEDPEYIDFLEAFGELSMPEDSAEVSMEELLEESRADDEKSGTTPAPDGGDGDASDPNVDVDWESAVSSGEADTISAPADEATDSSTDDVIGLELPNDDSAHETNAEDADESGSAAPVSRGAEVDVDEEGSAPNATESAGIPLQGLSSTAEGGSTSTETSDGDVSGDGTNAEAVEQLIEVVADDAVSDGQRAKLRDALGLEHPRRTQVQLNHLKSRFVDLEAYIRAMEDMLDADADPLGDIEALQAEVSSIRSDVEQTARRIEDIGDELEAMDEEHAVAVEEVEGSLAELRSSIEQDVTVIARELRDLHDWRRRVAEAAVAGTPSEERDELTRESSRPSEFSK